MWKVYKKTGAFQLKTIKPTFNEKGFVTRNGAIFIEMAPGENGEWNWNNAVNFSLSDSDYGSVLYAKMLFEKSGKIDLKLTHFPNQGNVPKTFQIINGNKKGTYMVFLSYEDKKANTFFTNEELLVFFNLIQSKMPSCILP